MSYRSSIVLSNRYRSNPQDDFHTAFEMADLHPLSDEKVILINNREIAEVDYYFPEIPYALFIDGPHHDNPHRKETDEALDIILRRNHIFVKRIPANQVTQKEIQNTIDEIKELKEKRRE